MNPPKNILVALCGITPQIITEILYALIVRQKIAINELWLVTTAKGRGKISTRRVIEIYHHLVPPDTFQRFVATLDHGSIVVNRFCQYLSRIKRKLRKALGDEGLADFYIISAVGTYGKRYGIKLDRSKIYLTHAPDTIPDG